MSNSLWWIPSLMIIPFDELVEFGPLLFICVPTPIAEDGSCDTTIAKQVIPDLDRLLQGRPCDKEYNYTRLFT